METVSYRGENPHNEFQKFESPIYMTILKTRLGLWICRQPDMSSTAIQR
jgi:hypothetical protein